MGDTQQHLKEHISALVREIQTLTNDSLKAYAQEHDVDHTALENAIQGHSGFLVRMGSYPVEVRLHWSFINEGDKHPPYNIDEQEEDVSLSRQQRFQRALLQKVKNREMQMLDDELIQRPSFALPDLDPLLLKNEKTLGVYKTLQEMHSKIQSLLSAEVEKENERIRKLVAAPPAKKETVKRLIDDERHQTQFQMQQLSLQYQRKKKELERHKMEILTELNALKNFEF